MVYYVGLDDKYIENMKNSDTCENIMSGMENGSGDNFETDAQHFKQKLEMLQMRAGWNQYKKIGSTPSVHAEQPSNLIPTLRITSPPQQFLRVCNENGECLSFGSQIASFFKFDYIFEFF